MERYDRYSNKIKRWTKELSLGFTKSISMKEYHENINNIDNIDVKNMEESISIYNLINSFNKLYISFKHDLDKLEKMPFEKSIRDLSFFESKDKNKYLTLLIENPAFYDDEKILLEIKEENNIVNTYITNGLSAGEDYFFDEIDLGIDESIFKLYLDLFQKHQLFLELYRFLNNKFISSGISCSGINTKIDCIEKNLFSGLSSMNIFIGNDAINNEEKCEVSVNLGEELKLDLDKCQLQLWIGHPIYANLETYEYILKNIFLHGSKLEEYESRKTTDKNKAKILKMI